MVKANKNTSYVKYNVVNASFYISTATGCYDTLATEEIELGGFNVAGIWDSNLKRLIGDNPQSFVLWLLPGATYIRELSQHLNRGIDIDILYEVNFEGARILFHLEFQRSNNTNMANRVLEYNVFASCKFDCTVLSFVIYLKKERKIVEPPLIRDLPNGRQVMRLDFTNIKLWEIPTDDLRRTGLRGLLPLLSLTKDGGKPEIVDEAISIIEKLEEDEVKKANLLSITLTLAALAFEDEKDREKLRRRFQMYQDILRDSEIYQLIMQEGIEKERLVQLEHQRRTILRIVQTKFPKLARLAIDQTNALTDPEKLEDLIVFMGLSQTEEEAHQYLTGTNRAKN
ncbi:MAG TPA: hypothetical protein VNE38_08000 [Ktedonobacteraceae bacterium]|nr:hypothetical protein [Ktedonobacteraceae bacterium]